MIFMCYHPHVMTKCLSYLIFSPYFSCLNVNYPLYLCHITQHAIGHLTTGFLATATPCLHFHCESHLVFPVLKRCSVYCIRTN